MNCIEAYDVVDGKKKPVGVKPVHKEQFDRMVRDLLSCMIIHEAPAVSEHLDLEVESERFKSFVGKLGKAFGIEDAAERINEVITMPPLKEMGD